MHAFLAALLSIGAVACQSSSAPMCNCGTVGPTSVNLPCGADAQSVTVTGPGCSAGPTGPQSFAVKSTVAGICRVQWTAAGGATASTDVTFWSVWLPCGSDPHGCGEVVRGPWMVTEPGDGGPCADGGTTLDSGTAQSD